MTNSLPLYRTLLNRELHMRNLIIACALAGFFALPAHGAPQQTSPRELVGAALQNQMKDDSSTHLFTWMECKHREHGTQLERVVQTPKGAISRILLINDKPLNPEQQSAEQERVRKMLDPAQMRHKMKEQREDDERTRKMLSTIPDAFDFTYIGSIIAPNGHKLVRIKFTPRPSFSPPSRESMVFTGMQGEIVVDETACRLTKIDGTLFKDVEFGWGILGRLYKGGRFLVEQAEVSPSHWETTKLILHFDGKALFFKSIHVDDNETDWDFEPVAPMSVEQALDFLNRNGQAQNAMLSK